MNTRSRQSRRKASPPRPGEPPRPPAPLGRTLVAMIARGDPEALILAEYARELAAFLRAEEIARRGGAPIHIQLRKKHERECWL